MQHAASEIGFMWGGGVVDQHPHFPVYTIGHMASKLWETENEREM